MKFTHLTGLHFTKSRQKPFGRYDKDTLRSFRGFHHNSLCEKMEDLNDYLDLLEAVPASVLHEKVRKQFGLAAYCRLD